MTRSSRVFSSTPALSCLVTLVGLSGLLPAQAIGTLVPIPLNLSADMAMHVANRMTFGQTEALVTGLTGPSSLATAWINAQLAPNFPADNPDVAGLLAQIQVPAAPVALGANHTFAQIKDGAHVYSAVSDFQLAARMAYFWDRHFNTFGPFVSGYVTVVYGGLVPAEGENITSRLEWIDYEYYRQNGLGTFRALAGHTFFSPAMMIYLDSVINECNGVEANENMAREFMELHTLGATYAVDGTPNYGTLEIDTVAKVMAGWRLAGNGYATPLTASFDPTGTLSCSFTQTIFNTTTGVSLYTAAGGANAVDLLIDHLVASDACKDFICRKLMNEFLGDGSDVVYPVLLTAMKNLWGTQGDLQAVVGRLLKSGEFLSAGTKWQRAKTPFESAVSHMRIWNGKFRKPSTNGLDSRRVTYMRNHTENIGESLFGFPTPDGFDPESNHQPGSSVTMMTFRLFSNSYYTKAIAPPPQAPYELGGVWFELGPWVTASLGAPANQNPAAIATLFLTRAYGSKWTSTDLAAVGNALSQDVNGVVQPLNPANPNDYAERLGQGAMATMSMNQGLLR